MFGLFKQKSDPKKIINNFQAKAFKAWGVEPNDIATDYASRQHLEYMFQF